MGAFRHPVAALRAILRAQAALSDPPDGMVPLHLKAGMHHGPCLAVTFNQQIDYFGTTVNLAARLERLSSGADVIISRAMRLDPEVEAVLTEAAGLLAIEPFEATLKGFDVEPAMLYRITALPMMRRVSAVKEVTPDDGP
jgi:class 3 adenylate cyclase